ncbi:putative transporter protein [Podospora didyma]|uniref:Transporter protein n=1 Tax=Podospora didyma TaxID=330526 RepID=A0AAE0NYZ5_9PEZI|nr:putative transporter protein [Podospora didyma]
MVGVGVFPIAGTADLSRIEAPVTIKAYLLCAFAAFGGIFFGYDTGWMSGVLGMPYFISMYTGLQYDYETGSPIGIDKTQFGLPTATKSLMTSILSCGTFFGALIAGDVADFFGRRPIIITGCIIFCVGCVLEIASTSQEVLFVMGRLVSGLGVGFISAVIILYMSEVAPRRFRGALVSGYQFCITIGILLASCVCYSTSNRNDTGSYRIPIAIQFLWAIILGVGLFLLPESPRYHVMKGMLESAARDLSRVRGQPVDSDYIKDELAEIVANHEYEMQVIPQTSYIGSWMACFQGRLTKGNGNLRRTILGTGMQMMQQLTGINFIFYFGTTFFQELGTIQNPFFISLVTTLVNVVSTPISFWSIEYFGRRPLLIWGACGMIITQFIVAIVGVTAGRTELVNGKEIVVNDSAVKAMIAFICIYIFSFATTWGPVGWVIIGECFPLPIRSRGVGISTASNWFWNCIIAVITPYMVGNDPGSANLGPKVFFIWGSLCFLSLTFAYFLVPEMKGLTLEQIDKMMEETSPRTSAKWSVATILVSCKQTRFHIESPNYRELDIEGLNITVQSSAPPAEGKASSSSAKGKGKAVKGEGTEILNNAKLRLKAGSRYALIGRNGSGKSTLLRAIAEKLIPGIPEKTRISILQQTNAGDANTDEDHSVSAAGAGQAGGPTVLEDVVDKATAKSELEQEINFLTNGVNSEDAYGALRAVRKIRHERMQKRLFVLDKDARLRSGARGLQARKALVEYEKAVAESAALNGQPAEDITPSALQAETQEAVDMLAELQLQVEPSRLADIESQAKNILLGLGFSEAYLARPASSLSGGWQMRKALATCLLQSETDILILDEPTNFLDLLGILWLQRYLQSLSESEPDSSPTLILVSHDRDFVSLCTDLLILRDKSLSYFHGSLPTYEESQSERRVYLSKMKDAQDKQKAHIQDTIQKNMAAGRKNDDQNKMRQAKSRQKKIDDRWGMQTNAKGGRFKLNRDMAGFHLSARADIDIPDAERSVHVLLPEPMELRFPGALISLENVAFRYPSPPNKGKGKAPPAAPDTLQDITLSVGMGDRIGILGLNGAGKSTLIKLLVDDARPTRGTATRHPRLKLGYYSQHAVENLQKLALAELDSTQKELTALALLSREVAGELDEGEIRGLLGSLGLPGRIASDVPVRKLSGGQLVRCELARILWKRPHCLVLDEVTTHLDYETVTALREALRGWAGAVVLVSHDRWFMRGAIEGIIEDTTGSGDSGDDGDGSEDEKEALRRRVVYRLKAGKLVRLEGGVQEFEDVMERRAKKLLAE